MIRRIVLSAAVLAVSTFSAGALQAQPNDIPAAVRTVAKSEGKLIKFSLRNDSSATMRLKAGDSEISLAPGKKTELKLAQGVTIIALEAANRAPGSVVTTVQPLLSGNTLVLR